MWSRRGDARLFTGIDECAFATRGSLETPSSSGRDPRSQQIQRSDLRNPRSVARGRTRVEEADVVNGDGKGSVSKLCHLLLPCTYLLRQTTQFSPVESPDLLAGIRRGSQVQLLSDPAERGAAFPMDRPADCGAAQVAPGEFAHFHPRRARNAAARGSESSWHRLSRHPSRGRCCGQLRFFIFGINFSSRSRNSCPPQVPAAPQGALQTRPLYFGKATPVGLLLGGTCPQPRDHLAPPSDAVLEAEQAQVHPKQGCAGQDGSGCPAAPKHTPPTRISRRPQKASPRSGHDPCRPRRSARDNCHAP